jgi:hypothetical protein
LALASPGIGNVQRRIWSLAPKIGFNTKGSLFVTPFNRILEFAAVEITTSCSMVFTKCPLYGTVFFNTLFLIFALDLNKTII